jgi:hypothetical protein
MPRKRDIQDKSKPYVKEKPFNTASQPGGSIVDNQQTDGVDCRRTRIRCKKTWK